MIVCIAEKPSVARDIADVLGAREKKDGYIEGNGYQVTWTFGHLCTLKEPHEYTPDWKQWRLEYLPMIPPRFGIKLIDNPTYERQFHTIERLMQAADMIINCGDAGQEGELIQRWVMQKAGAHCPVKRLWISSLTEEAIREGFAQLRDAADFQPLYEAGLSRAIGDWLLGMNATRLYTMKYGQNRQVLSIGRVQTPTLALIVNRQLEIQHFVPKQYWVLNTVYRETSFSALVRKSEEELLLEAEKQKDNPAAKKPKKEDENRGIDPITDRARGEELLARIKSVLRRGKSGGEMALCLGNVSLEPESSRVLVAGHELPLLKKEFDILFYFMQRPNHLVDKSVLAEAVWGDHADQSDNFNYVYQQVANLKRKLRDAGATIQIQAVYGFGYKLTEN